MNNKLKIGIIVGVLFLLVGVFSYVGVGFTVIQDGDVYRLKPLIGGIICVGEDPVDSLELMPAGTIEIGAIGKTTFHFGQVACSGCAYPMAQGQLCYGGECGLTQDLRGDITIQEGDKIIAWHWQNPSFPLWYVDWQVPVTIREQHLAYLPTLSQTPIVIRNSSNCYLTQERLNEYSTGDEMGLPTTDESLLGDIPLPATLKVGESKPFIEDYLPLVFAGKFHTVIYENEEYFCGYGIEGRALYAIGVYEFGEKTFLFNEHQFKAADCCAHDDCLPGQSCSSEFECVPTDAVEGDECDSDLDVPGWGGDSCLVYNGIPILSEWTCENGYKKKISEKIVECCETPSRTCPSGEYCNASHMCEREVTPQKICPFQCCVGGGGYFEQNCTEKYDCYPDCVCCSGKCVTEEKCRGEGVKLDLLTGFNQWWGKLWSDIFKGIGINIDIPGGIIIGVIVAILVVVVIIIIMSMGGRGPRVIVVKGG